MSENKISVTSNNSYAQTLFELASESNVLSEIGNKIGFDLNDIFIFDENGKRLKS